jgi:parallel beta-helix repeat protein
MKQKKCSDRGEARRGLCICLVGVLLSAAIGCGGSSGSSSQGPVRSPVGAPTPTPPPNPLFVRSSGNDANSGADPLSALRTIGRALDVAVSGSRIVVGPGTYEEAVNTARQGANPQALMFIADISGSQTGDRPGPVIIDASKSSVSGGFSLSTVPGGLIDGFTITGGLQAGIHLRNRSNNFVVQNCVVFANEGDGILVEDSSGVLLLNNLIYANPGNGITLGGNLSGSPDVRVMSNTITDNIGIGLLIGTPALASPRAVVRNNIIQNNLGDANVVAELTSDRTYSGAHNLVFPGSYDPPALQAGTDLLLDARFIDPSGANYHLLPESPAIDRNSALGLTDAQMRNLRQRTTTGTNLDTGLLDLGFHFPRER